MIEGETRRTAKLSDYESFFLTWDEAHSYLLGRADAKVSQARRQLELANATLGNIKGMKPPPQ